ncbi:MAG: hypothetical protein HUK20_08310, partial [Fibrobacter sp.]|nr:hypothetical protein [Fibrobacter sp.]
MKIQLRGDEFCRIMTTVDGCAIALDEDGYYKYASYDAGGRKHAGPYRADRPAPTAVMNASRNIPYRMISRNGAKQRLIARQSTKAFK